jgi:hypothetical protein
MKSPVPERTSESAILSSHLSTCLTFLQVLPLSREYYKNNFETKIINSERYNFFLFFTKTKTRGSQMYQIIFHFIIVEFTLYDANFHETLNVTAMDKYRLQNFHRKLINYRFIFEYSTKAI